MKKILSIISILVFGISFTYGANTVNIYATVGSVNQASRFTYIDPDFDIMLLESGSLASFTFGASDPESDVMYYTLSADGGTVNPINGSIHGSGSANFVYLAPNTPDTQYTITITLNDTYNIVSKNISVYVY